MDGLPWYTESRVMRGTSPSALLPGARSVVCLGLSYFVDSESPRQPESGEGMKSPGRVARYAWVRDYHRVMKRRMRELVRELERELGATISARWYVDDGPMLDRATANRSGIGWFGKNTNILTSGFGVMGLPWSSDYRPGTGGRCAAAKVLRFMRALHRRLPDGGHRCSLCYRQLALHLIPHHREPRADPPRAPPADAGLGVRLRHLPGRMPGKPEGKGVGAAPSLLPAVPRPRAARRTRILKAGWHSWTWSSCWGCSEEEFRARFAGTSIMRAKRVGMQRNACVALGNLGDERSEPALSSALREAEPLVRGHAAWALGRIAGAAGCHRPGGGRSD